MNESAVYEDRRGVTRVRGPMASPVVPKARGRGSERDPSWPANADLRGVEWMWCFFFQAEDGIRDLTVTGVQTCALPIFTHADIAHRGRYLNARRALGALVERGVVPIINENDTVSVEEIKFGDNDSLAAKIGRASCRERV